MIAIKPPPVLLKNIRACAFCPLLNLFCQLGGMVRIKHLPKGALLLFALLVIIFLCMPVFAQSGKPMVHELVTVLSVWSGEDVDDNLSKAASKYIDYAGMAERVIGLDLWMKLMPSKRREFTEIFQRLVEQRYYPRWHRIFKKAKLVYQGEFTAGEETVVKTSLEVGKKVDLVIWRLHPINGGLRVLNLTVNDKDLIKRLRGRFSRHIDRDGFEGMMAWLRNKLDDDDVHERTSMVP